MIRERVSLIVTGARLWSAGPVAGADAIAVAGDRVVAMGRASEVLALADSATRRIEARGATVTPGLTDAHVHLLPWALSLAQPDLHAARTARDAVALVRDALVAQSEPGLLVGRGWDDRDWPDAPHRSALDAVARELPVVLHSHDFHSLWVNGAALRAAGVRPDAPDPPGGRFERDAAGALTGIVRETAGRAFHELERARGPRPDDAVLGAAAAALHARGVTAVHDFHRDAETARWTRRLAGQRRLRVLQQVGLEQLEGLVAAGLGSGAGDDWFRVGALKLFADGTLGSRTAALLEPFADRGGTGLDVTPPEELRAVVARAFAGGVSVAIHAIGDRAVRHALDAIERGLDRAAPPAIPPRIEHVQLLDDADRPRFAALGVVASMQPQHCVTDAPAARAAWGRRCARAYPWRALIDAGAVLVFGSDAPVEPPDPGAGLAAAIGRRAPGEPADSAFEPAQAVSLDEALSAYTHVPAALGRGGFGRLGPGAPADLVVWDRDLHAASPEGLGGARPTSTVLGGEIVYESPVTAASGRGSDGPPGTR